MAHFMRNVVLSLNMVWILQCRMDLMLWSVSRKPLSVILAMYLVPEVILQVLSQLSIVFERVLI